MKLNSILYFILISYINSSEMIKDNVGPGQELIPLSAFIDPINNLYYVFFF